MEGKVVLINGGALGLVKSQLSSLQRREHMLLSHQEIYKEEKILLKNWVNPQTSLKQSSVNRMKLKLSFTNPSSYCGRSYPHYL